MTTAITVPTARTGRPSGSHRRRRAAAGAASLVVAFALAGCAGSGSSTSSASIAPDTVGGAVPAVGAPAVGDGTKEAAGGGTTSSGLGAQLATTNDRSIVVRSDVSVLVADVGRATAALGTIALRHGASIASQSTSSGTGPTPLDYPASSDGKTTCPSTGCPTPYASSSTTLRLDNSAVDALLRDVAGLGTVQASTRTSDDVTAEVADVDARVRNAQASLARVRALMVRATKVGEIVALEGELSKRQSDLEALEARQRTLVDQAAEATVTVRLVDSGAPVVAESRTGFLAGLQSGWDAFTGAMVGALTVVGALVPFLLLVVPVGLVIWLVARRRRAAPTTAPSPGT